MKKTNMVACVKCRRLLEQGEREPVMRGSLMDIPERRILCVFLVEADQR